MRDLIFSVVFVQWLVGYDLFWIGWKGSILAGLDSMCFGFSLFTLVFGFEFVTRGLPQKFILGIGR